MSVQSDLKERQRQLDDDFRFVLTNPQGRRFLAALLDNCGLYAESPDLGKRMVAVGLRHKAIMLDPRLWALLDADIVARRVAPPKPKQDDVEVEDE